jgi:hypothetical protein
MIAQSIMEELRAAGITLTCKGDVLRASPKSRLDDHLRGCIREHKPELLALLGTPSGARHRAVAASAAAVLPQVVVVRGQTSTAQLIDLTAFAERCAILQYDNGLSRQEAERAAIRELGHECIEEFHAAAIEQWRGEILALPELNNRDVGRLASMSLDFLANEWAATALACGWDDIALFAVFDGPWPTPRSRLDGQGLVPAIALSLLPLNLVEINAGAAILASHTGSRLRHERFLPGAQYCDVWWRVLGREG